MHFVRSRIVAFIQTSKIPLICTSLDMYLLFISSTMYLFQFMAESNDTEMAKTKTDMDEGNQNLTGPVLGPLSHNEKVNEM